MRHYATLDEERQTRERKARRLETRWESVKLLLAENPNCTECGREMIFQTGRGMAQMAAVLVEGVRLVCVGCRQLAGDAKSAEKRKVADNV